MATLTTRVITRGGLAIGSATASAGGDAAVCDRNNFLRINNGSGASITVTIAIPAGTSGYPGAAYTSTQVAIPAGGIRLIGPLTPQLYQDPTTGLCTITYSLATSVNVALFSLPEY